MVTPRILRVPKVLIRHRCHHRRRERRLLRSIEGGVFVFLPLSSLPESLLSKLIIQHIFFVLIQKVPVRLLLEDIIVLRQRYQLWLLLLELERIAHGKLVEDRLP